MNANGSDSNPFRTKLVFIRTKTLTKQFAECSHSDCLVILS